MLKLPVLDQETVVPLVGTWIEIAFSQCKPARCRSCPSWARGLKFGDAAFALGPHDVVPLVGTWIEIIPSRYWDAFVGRAPRGHVD